MNFCHVMHFFRDNFSMFTCSYSRADWTVSPNWKMLRIDLRTAAALDHIEIVVCNTNDFPYWICTLGLLLDFLEFQLPHRLYCSTVSIPSPTMPTPCLSLARKRIQCRPYYQTAVVKMFCNLLWLMRENGGKKIGICQCDWRGVEL